MDTEDHTVRLAATAEIDKLDLPRVLTGLTAQPLLLPEDGTLDDVRTSVASPALRGTAGLQTAAATEGTTAALLPVEEQAQEDSGRDDEWQNYRTEGVALQEIVDGVHHGSSRPVLVVGRIEEGAEGVVKNSVDGSIDKTVHAGVGKTADCSVEQLRHVWTDQ